MPALPEAPATTPPSAWVFFLLAIPTAALGITAAGVSAFLFILGLEQTEANSAAKHALTAIGLLLVAAELLAFFLPTLLVGSVFRGWRFGLKVFGIALIIFQISTVTVTQRTLVAATDLTAQANTSRATELRTQITSLRESAAEFRKISRNYADSESAAQRNRAQSVMRDAMEIEKQIPALANELSRVETETKPTLSSVFTSPLEKTVFLGARASLVALTGILMFSLSGAMLRTYLQLRAQPITPTLDPSREPLNDPSSFIDDSAIPSALTSTPASTSRPLSQPSDAPVDAPTQSVAEPSLLAPDAPPTRVRPKTRRRPTSEPSIEIPRVVSAAIESPPPVERQIVIAQP